MMTVVVPLYNEEESLATLHAELARAFGPLGPVEFIFVDDGSRDRSWAIVRELAARDAAGPRHPPAAQLRQGGGA